MKKFWLREIPGTITTGGTVCAPSAKDKKKLNMGLENFLQVKVKEIRDEQEKETIGI